MSTNFSNQLLIALPALNLLGSLVLCQTLMGNFPQRIRWRAHRYLLRQSVGYFQDEFAGRIAQRLMQTALAVREVAMKATDVGTYVVVYFLGALVLAIGFGLIPLVAPRWSQQMPHALHPLLESGILLTSIAAVVLNLFFNGARGDTAGAIEAAKTAEAH